MIVLTDLDLPSVNEAFEALSPLQSETQLRCNTHHEITQRFPWVQDISYVDSRSKQHTLSLIEWLETKPNKKTQYKTTKFKWVTNCKVSPNNVIPLANEGGRMRWKVENEGFNIQKNGGYALHHPYTNNPTSARVFYFLLQIAHMLAQLLDRGSLLKKAFPKGFGSAKNLALRLLDAWRNARIDQNAINAILAPICPSPMGPDLLFANDLLLQHCRTLRPQLPYETHLHFAELKIFDFYCSIAFIVLRISLSFLPRLGKSSIPEVVLIEMIVRILPVSWFIQRANPRGGKSISEAKKHR